MDEPVEYERQRMARIKSNQMALKMVGLGADAEREADREAEGETDREMVGLGADAERDALEDVENNRQQLLEEHLGEAGETSAGEGARKRGGEEEGSSAADMVLGLPPPAL